MKIVIINGSARKGNVLTAIDAFQKGAAAPFLSRDWGVVPVSAKPKFWLFKPERHKTRLKEWRTPFFQTTTFHTDRACFFAETSIFSLFRIHDFSTLV